MSLTEEELIDIFVGFYNAETYEDAIALMKRLGGDGVLQKCELEDVESSED